MTNETPKHSPADNDPAQQPLVEAQRVSDPREFEGFAAFNTEASTQVPGVLLLPDSQSQTGLQKWQVAGQRVIKQPDGTSKYEVLLNGIDSIGEAVSTITTGENFWNAMHQQEPLRHSFAEQALGHDVVATQVSVEKPLSNPTEWDKRVVLKQPE